MDYQESEKPHACVDWKVYSGEGALVDLANGLQEEMRLISYAPVPSVPSVPS
jgi:hypothetical protein